jgi:hypothetical protein
LERNLVSFIWLFSFKKYINTFDSDTSLIFGTWIWTQDLAFASQELYHLSHIPSPFCFSYFSDSILLLPRRTVILLPRDSCIALVTWCDFFYPGWPADPFNLHFLSSSDIGMSQHT